MSSSKNTSDEMGDRRSRDSASQNSNSQPDFSSPYTLPSVTLRQTISGFSKVSLGFDDDARSLGVASTKARQPVTLHTNPLSGRSSRAEFTRRSNLIALEMMENKAFSSGIASASPITPPTSPRSSSNQPNAGISSSQRGLKDGIRLTGIAPSVLSTPPTSPSRNDLTLTTQKNTARNIKISSLKTDLGLDVS
ncbi:hypothetical protein N431DRAFT_443522 [Stipitochalara longipes BDJ]|nr:hypothetical protein N431DRAFT_443522 [Stipitochalara longipes BDJ]